MSTLFLIISAIVIFVAVYLTYGCYLAKAWGIMPGRKTTAYKPEESADYAPSRIRLIKGHPFSSIAENGPVNGSLQTVFFGWMPCFLWIVVSGIFFGAIQDFGVLVILVIKGSKVLRDRKAARHL